MPPVSFDTVEVSKVFSNKFRVSWSVTLIDPIVDINEVSFDIYRSFDPVSNFDKIGVVDGGGAGLFYIDIDKEYRRNAVRFYKVIAVEKLVPGNTAESPSHHLNDNPDGVLNTIITRNEMLLRNFAGEPCRILKHYKSGSRCTECWDNVKQVTTQSHCESCFGTGWNAGYHNPIEGVQVHINESPFVSNIREPGEDQTKNDQSWMSNNPPVSPRDLLIPDSSGIVYRIERVDRTTKKSIAIYSRQYAHKPVVSRQVLLLKEIDPTRVEYSENIIKEPLPAGVGYGNGGYGSGVFETTG